MKIMCDTNIIMDMLLEREPFADDSCTILALCEERRIDGFVSASSVTDIYYLIRKHTHSTDLAYRAVGKLLEIHCDYIVTRNKRDFEEFNIPLLTPSEFLQHLPYFKTHP